MPAVQFFIDFDGTITTVDVVDTLLQRFADKSWMDVEKEWAEGHIGSRECLDRQIWLVRATQQDVERLMAEVRIDAHFVEFLETARKLAVPVTVVSDGFDVLIREILKKNVPAPLLSGLPVFSNGLRWESRGPVPVFSDTTCGHGCANCKLAVLKQARAGTRVVLVGDGLSDRFAAEAADLTFAKKLLLEYCRQREIRHRAYTDFRSIREWVQSGCELEAAESGCHGSV